MLFSSLKRSTFSYLLLFLRYCSPIYGIAMRILCTTLHCILYCNLYILYIVLILLIPTVRHTVLFCSVLRRDGGGSGSEGLCSPRSACRRRHLPRRIWGSRDAQAGVESAGAVRRLLTVRIPGTVTCYTIGASLFVWYERILFLFESSFDDFFLFFARMLVFIWKFRNALLHIWKKKFTFEIFFSIYENFCSLVFLILNFTAKNKCLKII